MFQEADLYRHRTRITTGTSEEYRGLTVQRKHADILTVLYPVGHSDGKETGRPTMAS